MMPRWYRKWQRYKRKATEYTYPKGTTDTRKYLESYAELNRHARRHAVQYWWGYEGIRI
jgi:hypothetical protein